MSTPYRAELDPRAVRRFVLRLALIVAVVIALAQTVSVYVENLWFESLGYSSVYWYQLRAQGITFLAFAFASGLLLWILFRLVTPSGSRPRPALIRFGDEHISVPSSDSVRKFALPAATLLGVIIGLAFSGDWNTFALFLNQPPPAGVVDPIFGQPLTFYFFSLPVMGALAGWFLTISFIGVVVSGVGAVTDSTGKFKGVSIAIGVLLLAIAVET